MSVQYGSNCKSQRKAYELMERFKAGWRRVDDVVDDQLMMLWMINCNMFGVKEQTD
jgi:hypothetical protein